MKRFAYNKDHETDPALLRHKSLSVDGHHSANGLLGCCLPPHGPFAQYMLPNGLFAYYVPPSVSGNRELTTVMLRDIPLKYTHELLWEFMETCGFRGTYDFIYLPTDFAHGTNMGYGFINFRSPLFAQYFILRTNGVRLPLSGNSSKSCTCCWARIQGYEANVAHVASSPFDQLPENVKPIVLDQHGIRIPFTCRSGDKTLSRRKSNKEARKHGRPDPRKVFIGGIHAGVSEDSMREAILNCIPRGTGVVDCSLVRDLRTGSNRGFGFVTFDSDKTAAFVLNKYYYSSLPCPLSIDGRAVSVKPYVVL
ncbi:hypothetical protein FOZ62_021581 [Perkinsus olseni]|uniref:RRM domain-containing protein n=1 Tax=Perkinsus olseni TaxID=32597 RepID=A0A7J6S0Q0_PEROL|nr:hypothetical protein FOZ62_021581 [Perkinsus olseni]